jgi:glycosyltransferase involved in cell wall biosynthesis
MRQRTLLVIIPDRISDIVRKGEYTARYYNPGDLFDEVHLLMTNDDRPDPKEVQKTVGRAILYLHNLPIPSFASVLGWWPTYLKFWVAQGVRLAKEISPQAIRTYGNFVNGYLAAKIRKYLAIPLIVSLHTHPDVDMREETPWWPNWKERMVLEFSRRFERETLRSADCVIIVYKSQREYALRNGATDVRLIYNIVNPFHLQKKTNYQLNNPPRILSVGRLFKRKNPENVIRAVGKLNANLTLIGDGEYYDRLLALAQRFGISDRVEFLKAVPNDELCRMLPNFDIFATHNDCWGIPKAVLEPLLTGLPVVINCRQPEPVPELNGDWVLAVKNTEEAYRRALKELVTDHQRRELLGQRGYTYARQHFAPEKMEQQMLDLYQEFLTDL